MINTETNTKTETEIDVGVLKVVEAYTKFELRAQSHYFPMVEKALELYERNMEKADIAQQFRLAFAKVHKLEPKQYEKDPEYVQFRLIANIVVNIASRGREWYGKHRKDKIGFYRMFELCKTTEEEPEVKSKKKGNPKPAEPKVDEPEEDEAKAEDEEEIEPDALADKAWFTKCRQIVRQEPEAFIQMIAGLVENDHLPEVILEPISQYLREEHK